MIRHSCQIAQTRNLFQLHVMMNLSMWVTSHYAASVKAEDDLTETKLEKPSQARGTWLFYSVSKIIGELRLSNNFPAQGTSFHFKLRTFDPRLAVFHVS